MQIIHLILGKVNPDRLNGVNKVVFQLATQQVECGKKIAVWGVTKDTTHNYPHRTFSTRLFQASSLPFILNDGLKSAILKEKNTIFHLHGGWIPLYFSLALFFHKHNINFVLTPHGAYNTIAMKRSGFIKKIYFKLFESKLVQYAHKIHCIGQSEVQGLNKIFQNEKSILIPYGFDFTINESVKNQDEEFIVGYMGRLDVYTKGLDLILVAFKKFQEKYADSQLWIIGSGDGKEWIEKYIQQNQLKNITLWGQKFGEEKNDLIKKMSVFLHPSRNEGLPTAVLEVASFGIPSIVSYATNLGDYIQKYDAGISIPNESSAAIFSALERIKSNTKTDYKSNSIQLLEQEFSWKKLIPEFDKLYEL